METFGLAWAWKMFGADSNPHVTLLVNAFNDESLRLKIVYLTATDPWLEI